MIEGAAAAVGLLVGFTAWRLRVDYRKPTRLVRFGAVALPVLLAAGVALLVARRPKVAGFAFVVAAGVLAVVIEALANRRLASRMAELRAEQPALATKPQRVPLQPPPPALDIERRALWSIKIDGLAGLRRDLGTLAFAAVRSFVSHRFRGRAVVADLGLGGVGDLHRSVDERRGTLFLWVFEADPEHDLIDAARRLGPVYYLRGGGALADGNTWQALRNRLDEVIESTPAEVETRLQQMDASSGRSAELFPLHSMLCSDAVWQQALEGFLDRADTVVMDLTAFARGRAGCEYELGRLIDRVPAGRIVLVTGRRSDESLLERLLREQWSTMPAGSPNASGTPGPLLVVKARYLRNASGSRTVDGKRVQTPREREIEAFVGLLAPRPAPLAG